MNHDFIDPDREMDEFEKSLIGDAQLILNQDYYFQRLVKNANSYQDELTTAIKNLTSIKDATKAQRETKKIIQQVYEFGRSTNIIGFWSGKLFGELKIEAIANAKKKEPKTKPKAKAKKK